MTRIDFYLQQAPAIVTLETWVCRLVDKAFSQGHQVYVLAPDQKTATHLDHLLWTFSPGSFIPHALWGAAFVPDDALPRPFLGSTDQPQPPTPVLIGPQEPPVTWQDTLVTLSADIPGCFSRFERVAEFVAANEDAKQRARERFRFYRDRGYALETHDI